MFSSAALLNLYTPQQHNQHSDSLINNYKTTGSTTDTNPDKNNLQICPGHHSSEPTPAAGKTQKSTATDLSDRTPTAWAAATVSTEVDFPSVRRTSGGMVPYRKRSMGQGGAVR